MCRIDIAGEDVIGKEVGSSPTILISLRWLAFVPSLLRYVILAIAPWFRWRDWSWILPGSIKSDIAATPSHKSCITWINVINLLTPMYKLEGELSDCPRQARSFGSMSTTPSRGPHRCKSVRTVRIW